MKFSIEILNKYNYGLFIIRDNETTRNIIDEKSASYSATVVWKLIYQHGPQEYGICNFLTDGWCFFIGTKEDVVDYLNNNPYGDIYRILTQEEMNVIINLRSNSKQLFYE